MTTPKDFHISDIIGHCGTYQCLVATLTFLLGVGGGSGLLVIELSAPNVDIFWNWDTVNRTVFKSTDCSLESIYTLSSNSNNSSFLIYETEYAKHTLTEKLNLVCERSWIISFSKFLFLIGGTFGNLATGCLSEKYGRRLLPIIFMMLALVSNLCLQFPQGWLMLAVASFLSGIAYLGSIIIVQAQHIELIPITQRQFYGNVIKCGSVLGQISICGIAWFAQDWFYVQLFQTIVTAVCLLLSVFLMESPVWLMAKNKPQEAKRNIFRILRMNCLDTQNRTNNIDLWIEQIKDPTGTLENGTFCDLFANRVIIKYTICTTVVTFSVSSLNYALTMNIGSFGSDLHLDIVVSNALSLAALLITTIALKITSTKDVHSCSLLLCGVICAIYPIVYGYSIARTVIASLIRAFTSAIAGLNLFYSSEIFPTSVRVVGGSTTFLVSRPLSALIPFTKELGEKTAAYAPFILFAAIAFIGFAINLLLPERKGKPLVQTVQELKPARDRSSSPSVYVVSTKL